LRKLFLQRVFQLGFGLADALPMTFDRRFDRFAVSGL
jgi:hypothetical protein